MINTLNNSITSITLLILTGLTIYISYLYFKWQQGLGESLNSGNTEKTINCGQSKKFKIDKNSLDTFIYIKESSTCKTKITGIPRKENQVIKPIEEELNPGTNIIFQIPSKDFSDIVFKCVSENNKKGECRFITKQLQNPENKPVGQRKPVIFRIPFSCGKKELEFYKSFSKSPAYIKIKSFGRKCTQVGSNLPKKFITGSYIDDNNESQIISKREITKPDQEADEQNGQIGPGGQSKNFLTLKAECTGKKSKKDICQIRVRIT